MNYDTSRRTYPDAVAPPPQAVAPEAPKTTKSASKPAAPQTTKPAQSHKAKPAPSQTAKPTSKDQQKKSEPKVHTLDQEYHLKESNSDTVMEKDEQWVRKERREKSSEAVFAVDDAPVETPYAVYALASVGLGALIYGAAKHYLGRGGDSYKSVAMDTNEI